MHSWGDNDPVTCASVSLSRTLDRISTSPAGARYAGVALRKLPRDGHPFAWRERSPSRPHLVERASSRRWLAAFPPLPMDMRRVVIEPQSGSAIGDHATTGLRDFAICAAKGRTIGKAMPEPIAQIERALDRVASEVVR